MHKITRALLWSIIFLYTFFLMGFAHSKSLDSVCRVLEKKGKHAEVYFPSWHIVDGQTSSVERPESDPVSVYGHTYYLYKDFLGFRGENIYLTLAALKDKLPVERYPASPSSKTPVDEGISFTAKEDDYRQYREKPEHGMKYSGLIDGQHRDVNLVKYDENWYYLIFLKRNSSESSIDSGNMFNAYLVNEDYSIDYICTGEKK